MTRFFNNDEYLTRMQPHPLDPRGIQMRFSYPNGYTASVIRYKGSYGGYEGLWEIAVLFGEEIVYDTPITCDVLGWQTNEEVEEVLQRIRELPARQ